MNVNRVTDAFDALVRALETEIEDNADIVRDCAKQGKRDDVLLFMSEIERLRTFSEPVLRLRSDWDRGVEQELEKPRKGRQSFKIEIVPGLQVDAELASGPDDRNTEPAPAKADEEGLYEREGREWHTAGLERSISTFQDVRNATLLALYSAGCALSPQETVSRILDNNAVKPDMMRGSASGRESDTVLYETVSRFLSKLRKDGEVKRVGRGQYVLSEKGRDEAIALVDGFAVARGGG